MLKVILAPVGAGKTEQALNTISRTLDHDPLARVWVLLATARQQTAFRQRLIEYDDGREIYFNIEFFNFYDLNRRLLNLAGVPSRCLNETARFSLLRAVIHRLNTTGALTFFSEIALSPGFVRRVAELIYELKQNQITPDAFTHAATQTGQAKDHDLALIYTHYQQALITHQLVDREGEGWLALETLKAQPHLAGRVQLLIVDGYDQFTPVQAEMLAVLAQGAHETLITLTTVPEREATIGRRFAQALNTLRQYAGQQITVETLTTEDSRRHPDLDHLTRTVFAEAPPIQAATDGVKLIAASSIAQEVGEVLRRVRGLLLDGVAPDDILIALRDWGRYQAHFMALQREYALSLVLHHGESLVSNPLIATLVSALELHTQAFHQRPLLGLLQSPYVIQSPLIAPDSVTLLGRISQHFTVIRGREHWETALKAAKNPTRDADNRPQSALLPSDSPLPADIMALFDTLTPPEYATPRAYIAWIEALIGVDDAPQFDTDDDETLPPVNPRTLNLIASARRTQDADILARDLLALQALKTILRQLLTAQDLMDDLNMERAGSTSQNEQVTWATFYMQFKIALEQAQINPRPNRNGRVLVTTAADARGLPHAHVIVVGLAEGIFPAPAGEDALYLDSERRALTDHGVTLATQAQRQADDGLFYELICLPSKSLTLSRPTAQAGEPWNASHLWRAVQDVFTPDSLPVTLLRAGEVVPIMQAASLDEAALAIASALNAPANIPPDETLAGGYRWLITEHHETWQRIQTAQSIESRRLSPSAPHNRYTGRLEDAGLRAQISTRLDTSYRWSASQLNAYGICPYRFFASRLLKLEALEEPEEGMDQLRRGTLIHAILEATYGEVITQGWTISPQNADHAESTLKHHAHDLLTRAPDELGFRPSALWEHEKKHLTDLLRRFIARDFSEESAVLKKFPHLTGERRPYRLEAPFGMDSAPALYLPLPGGDSLKIGGYIDRIDRIGDSLVVIDYKSGSSPYKNDARNVQILVYLYAAKQMLAGDTSASAPRDVAGGFFWNVPKDTGATHADTLHAEPGKSDEQIANMLAALAGLSHATRTGNFSAQPAERDAQSGKCDKYCDYHHLCRLCLLGIRKPAEG